jgi:hypothetical protein
MLLPSTKRVKTALRKYALTFEGSKEDHPWGETVTKVKGKVFGDWLRTPQVRMVHREEAEG